MKRRKYLVTIATVVLVLCLVLASLVYAAVPWTLYTGALSLDSELYVMDAWVIKDGATYKMWYTHGETSLSLDEIATYLTTILTDAIVNDIANQDLESLLNDLSGVDLDALWNFLGSISTVVGYAESSDGISWTVQNSQVLAGSSGIWDSVGFPCVIKNSATDYEMWYTHNKTTLTKAQLGGILIDLGDPLKRKDAILEFMNSTATAIGYATSPDGVTWTPTPEVFTSSGSGSLLNSVGFPSVIKNSATDYEMWYSHDKTTLTEADLDAILADIGNFGADDLWYILNNTSSVIDYTTSGDGITWAAPQEVLAGSSGVWDSVAAPSVIKTGGSYEMWYTHGTTDLTSTALQNLSDELLLLKPDFLALWDDLKAGDLNQFLTDFTNLIDNKMDNIKAILGNTSTVIGYATSGDGINWTVEKSEAFIGTSLWNSVASPSVIYNDGLYEMWYVKGIDVLTAQNLVDLLQGVILPIGYAYSGVSIDLVSGWNFIGLTLIPLSSDIGDVLAGIINEVEIVWYYDGSTDTWSRYIPGGPPPTLTEMTDGKGYWVKITNPCALSVTGSEPPLPYDIPLVVGWNLISLPETPSPSTIEDVLAGIIGDVEIVWYYDGSTDTWSRYIPGGPPPTLTEMTEGKAYWIKMSNPNTLTIP